MTSIKNRYMRILNLVLIFISLLFISCSEDDNSNENQNTPPTNGTNILGTWKIISSEEDGIDDKLPECLLRETLEFRANNILVNLSPSFDTSGECEEETLTGTYIIDGTSISLRGIDLIEENFDFTLTINTLTLIDKEDPDSLIIEVYEKVN